MSLSSYFNSSPVGIGTVDLSGYFNSYFNNNSSKNDQSQKPFQNQYYQDALKNPDNYTWGVWDANKPMSSDNWQPKPRQAGDARDPRSANYEQPMTYSSTVTGTGHVKSTSNNSNDSNNNKSNGSVNASNDNWTLPTYNYDPNLTWSFLNAVQSNSYNPQNQQYLKDNNALVDEAGRQQANRQAAAQWQGLQMANIQNWQNAQIDKWRNQPTSFSSSSVLDPNSRDGQAYQTWQNINLRNQIAAGEPARKSAELITQMQVGGNVDVAKTQAQGNVAAAQLTADANQKIAQIGATKDIDVAGIQTAIQKQIAELTAKKDMSMTEMQTAVQKQIAQMAKEQALATTQLQTDVQKQVAELAKEQAISAANIAAQSQMYGAQMGAMSNMFGSQMGAIGSMFGGIRGGGNGGRYW